MLAKFCHFYSCSIRYALGLGASRFYLLYNAITAIEAQETLREMLVSDWPNLNKNDRKRIDKDLRKKAYPIQSGSGQRALSTKELMAVLGKG